QVESAPAPGLHPDEPAQATGWVLAGVRPRGPLLMAASPGARGTSEHFYGKLEAPSLLGGALAAKWDFARAIGTDRIEDGSPAGLQGRPVTAPKRAVTGSRWDGPVHAWQQDPSHYAAIHFHGDDLADVGWQPSLRFGLPDRLKSGFYAVKLQSSGA